MRAMGDLRQEPRDPRTTDAASASGKNIASLSLFRGGRDAEKIGPRGRRNSLKRLNSDKEIKVNFSDFPCRNRVGPWKNSIRPNRSITHSTPERGPPSLGLLLQF